jgi:hypothetical protein
MIGVKEGIGKEEQRRRVSVEKLTGSGSELLGFSSPVTLVKKRVAQKARVLSKEAFS